MFGVCLAAAAARRTLGTFVAPIYGSWRSWQCFVGEPAGNSDQSSEVHKEAQVAPCWLQLHRESGQLHFHCPGFRLMQGRERNAGNGVTPSQNLF